jgi:hypothetical protein
VVQAAAAVGVVFFWRVQQQLTTRGVMSLRANSSPHGGSPGSVFSYVGCALVKLQYEEW